MLVNSNKRIYRIIDANLNRTREGLRVCEEVARFILNDKKITQRFKYLRHQISNSIKLFPAQFRVLLSARNSRQDVGKKQSSLEKKRRDSLDIFLANLQRSKESLRVLEEFSKLINPGLSSLYKRLRFKIYDLEKNSYGKIQSLSNSGSCDLCKK